MGKTYYAVAVGKNVGVFETWDETKASVTGFKDNMHKKFGTKEEAERFVQMNRKDISDDTSSVCSTDAREVELLPAVQAPSPPIRGPVRVTLARRGPGDVAKQTKKGTPSDVSSSSSADAREAEFLPALQVQRPTKPAPGKSTTVKKEDGEEKGKGFNKGKKKKNQWPKKNRSNQSMELQLVVRTSA